MCRRGGGCTWPAEGGRCPMVLGSAGYWTVSPFCLLLPGTLCCYRRLNTGHLVSGRSRVLSWQQSLLLRFLLAAEGRPAASLRPDWLLSCRRAVLCVARWQLRVGAKCLLSPVPHVRPRPVSPLCGTCPAPALLLPEACALRCADRARPAIAQ